MKLLERKVDIDKFRIADRKREVDEGIQLATKVDALRRKVAQEEKNLLDYRLNAIKNVQKEIDNYIEQKEILKNGIIEAEKYHKELLKPLTKEWKEIEQVKKDNAEIIQSISISQEVLKKEQRSIEEEKERISKIASEITFKLNETEKTKQQTLSLKMLAEREYELAQELYSKYQIEQERHTAQLNNSKREYEVALTTIEKEKEVLKEKEDDLIIREKHLASQQQNMKVVWEQIKRK